MKVINKLLSIFIVVLAVESVMLPMFCETHHTFDWCWVEENKP